VKPELSSGDFKFVVSVKSLQHYQHGGHPAL